MTIEIEKTYKIAFTEEQLRELFNLLVRNADDLRGTALNPIYYDIKNIFNIPTIR
jgi:hypothetical protein